MSNAPCKNCARKGCGSYHDECEKYQKYVNRQQEAYRKKEAAHDLMSFEYDRKRKSLKEYLNKKKR